ncbi:MAG TPA: hypothetical protein VLM38_06950 [Blastocatellia bacterium]|nr:hypothetical protein [Blastocatellia bacterium]
MDTLQAKTGTIEVEHRGGSVNLNIDGGESAVEMSLSIVEASQLVALLHKHINEAAVEKLRNKNAT